MPRKFIQRAGLVSSILCGTLFGGRTAVVRIREDREERERHFVSIHFIAMESARDSDHQARKTLAELMTRYAGGPGSLLLKPFHRGLVYRSFDGSFELAEPQLEFVSLFRRDRIVASESDWPHW